MIRHDFAQLAAAARRARHRAALFLAWEKCGDRSLEAPEAIACRGLGGNRRYWLQQARQAEELLQMYARAIERGWTAADSRLVAAFEGDPIGRWSQQADQARRAARQAEIEDAQ